MCAAIKTDTVATMTKIKSTVGWVVFFAPPVRTTRTTADITKAWITMLQILTPEPTTS
jgi:hypothetical protein